jgi:hypothetical protein
MRNKARVVALSFTVSNVPASCLFSQLIHSHGRRVGESKRVKRMTTVFSQDGSARCAKGRRKELLAQRQGVHAISQAAVVELAVHQGEQRQRDLASLRKHPCSTRTFRLSCLRSGSTCNSSSSFIPTALGMRFARSPGTQVLQDRRRAYHNGVNGGHVGSVVEQDKALELPRQAEHQLTVKDKDTQNDIEPKEVQGPAEKVGHHDLVEITQPTSTVPSVDCYSTDVTYPAGRPWRSLPIKNLRLRKVENDISSPSHLSIDLDAWRQSLLRTLATTQSAAEAWETYSNLLDLPDDRAVGKPRVPFAHMHRLIRILARHRPKTRKQFLRLLSVINAIKEAGGEIKLHEWNALIDGAGKGWRKTYIDDFRTSLGMYQDMISGRAPGKSLARDQDENELLQIPPVDPDIYTYTILISLASRTLHAPAFRYATSLLAASGLPPNRVTHLALLRYFTFTKQLSGVRSTLLKMQEQNLELGLDGVNACLWAYGHNGRVDLVMMVYRLFRHNMSPETYVGDDDVASVAHRLRTEEHIIIPPDMKPNEVAFTSVIQILAHHGNLLATLTVFMDMVSSENLEMGAPLVPDENGVLKPGSYSPTLPVFRAIFLGFSRHGVRLLKDGTAPPQFRATNPPGQPAWSLTNLQELFDTFLMLPEYTIISRSTVYWIMVAFEKTSGNDVTLLRRVWKQLKNRFKGPVYGPNNRLRRIQVKLFPEDCGRLDKNGRKA